MKCLVCREEKRITRFQDLFFLSHPSLCQHCEEQLILKVRSVKKQNGLHVILFEKNEFFLDIQQRIAKGDLILMDVYYEHVKKQVLKYLKFGSTIKVVESTQNPYPPMAVLKEKLEMQIPSLNEHKEKGVLVLSDFCDELIFSELNGFVTWISLY